MNKKRLSPLERACYAINRETKELFFVHSIAPLDALTRLTPLDSDLCVENGPSFINETVF